MNALFAATALFLMQIVGSESSYTVRAGDSLTSIGARFGVDVRVLTEANNLKPASVLQVGQALNIDNRHIVPKIAREGGELLVVNIPQRMLFFLGDAQPKGYPIAAGRPSWKTPLGEFNIVLKETDPTWDVPLSIQEEMRRAGKRVVKRVLPSPENPLGKFWIGLSKPGVGIHGTNAPSSIYSHATHGCMRLHPDDISALFSQVNVGDHGRIIYEPVLMSFGPDGVFLEVHPDIYKKGIDPLATVVERAKTEGLFDLLDMTRVLDTIRRRDGIARDVTKR
jgi:L,D-transpeptidase ErfK/SrfK